MLRLFVFIGMLAALSLSAPVSARADLVEFFFPSLKKKEPDPSETLVAPFADAEKSGPQSNSNKSFLKDMPLESPHRTREEIAQWLTMSVSEALTFDQGTLQQSLAASRKSFDEAGFRLYTEFLRDQSVIKLLDSGKFYMRSVIQEKPLLLNEGPVDGRYRWLFEVPVLLSFVDKNAQDYKKALPVNQAMVLTIQVGRVQDTENEHKILIERWSGRPLDKRR